ncbi:MAG: DNA-binding protein, partial [Desulfobacula sp.]|nr:DNA-binding protein [Desulfobacula sp.]
MNQSFYYKLCITNILNGVAEGLSKYSHPSKVALIFIPKENDPVSVFDPQNILRGHESKLKEIFYDNHSQWREEINGKLNNQPQGYMVTEDDLSLAGLISYGGCSNDFYYQMW